MFMRIKPTLKSLIPWREPEDSVKELKPWVRVAVTVYVLTLVPLLLFFLGMTLINLPRILATAYDSFVLTLHKLEHAGGVSIAVDAFQLIVLVLVPLGLALMFVQIGRKAGKGVWTVTEGRPVARAGAVALAGAAAAFAAYTWFPSSVYRPIQPGERGTIVGAVNQFEAVPTGRPALTKQRQQQLGGAPLKSKQSSGTQQPVQQQPTQTTTTNGGYASTTTTTPTTPTATTSTESTTTTSASTTASTSTTDTTSTASTVDTTTTTTTP